MKKNTLKENIVNMRTMTRNMPKTINEALNFEGDDESQFDYEPEEDAPVDEPEMGPEEPVASEEPEAPLNSANAGVEAVPGDMRKEVAHFVDDIRKKSLLGMAKLADYPNSQEFEQMKKLWQLCDKKPDAKQNSTL